MNRTRNSNRFKFSEGERVLCFEPDPIKARVLYDAKVLEIRAKKDGKGRRVVEYLIHFQGWNSSWDRYVAEAFILTDTEEHRHLQKELADAAKTALKENRKKRQRLGAVLRGAEPKFRTDSDSSSAEDGDSATRSSFDENPEGVEAEDAELSENQEAIVAESEVVFQIPDQIKHLLEEDCSNIKTHKKLIKLPCRFNVVTILEDFVRHYTCTLVSTKTTEKTRTTQRTNSTCSNTSSNAPETTTSTMLCLCKEVVDSLRVCFDFLLELVLLYHQERPQYQHLKRTGCGRPKDESSFVPPSQVADNPIVQDVLQWRLVPDVTSAAEEQPFQPCVVYGVVHLCRLLVKLPEVIQKMHLTEEKRRIVTNFSELLLQYIAKQKTLLSESYIANKSPLHL